MRKNGLSALKKVKIIVAAMLGLQLIYFFLPLNAYGKDLVSLMSIVSGANNAESVFSVDIEYYFGALAFAVNVLVFLSALFVRNSSRFRGICLPGFLASAIVFGFCWGLLIDKTGFVRSLYSFGLLYLISTVVCVAFALNLNEKS